MQSPHQPEQKNLLLAIGLSLVILLSYHYLVEKPKLTAMEAQRQAIAQQQTNAPTAAPITTSESKEEKLLERADALAQSPRIQIKTPSVTGTLNLRGARFDDLELSRYPQDMDSPVPVSLLSPANTVSPYYIEQGWLGENIKTPNANSIWQADKDVLSPGAPVTLRWNNGDGLTFIKTISVDENYLFTIEQRIENQSARTVTMYPFARIFMQHKNSQVQTAKTDMASPLVLRGLLGVLGGEYQSATFDKLSEKSDQTEETQTFNGQGGWLGITDKYWFTALIPDQTATIDARFVRTGTAPLTGMWPFRHIDHTHDGRDFQADYRAAARTIEPGAQSTYTSHFFAGAKEMRVLDTYEQSPGIPRFDLAVDFGWFYLITKPFFYMLTWLGQVIGNFGWAIILFTIVVRAAMFPLTAQSQKSMQRMKDVAPKMKELQARYKDDPTKLQGEMMQFYRKEKINPMAGCLPMLIQIPVFFALYKVLYITIEMRHAEFFGFLRDLSVADPSNIFNLFGIIPWDPPSVMHLGILPILMGLTSWLQMKLAPAPTDEMQKQIFSIMPWFLMIMLAGLPAGLLLYWVTSNILAIGQQWWIKRNMTPAN